MERCPYVELYHDEKPECGMTSEKLEVDYVTKTCTTCSYIHCPSYNPFSKKEIEFEESGVLEKKVISSE